MKKLSEEQITWLRNLVKKRFHVLPKDFRVMLHPILQEKKLLWTVFISSKYFVFSFRDENDKKRILDFEDKNIRPFPGLVAENVKSPVAYAIDKPSKNIIFDGVDVKNRYAIRLTDDCTIILRNFSHSFNIEGKGQLSYEIKLGYLISFGEEINIANVFNFLEDLIAYSIRHLSKTNVPK